MPKKKNFACFFFWNNFKLTKKLQTVQKKFFFLNHLRLELMNKYLKTTEMTCPLVCNSEKDIVLRSLNAIKMRKLVPIISIWFSDPI